MTKRHAPREPASQQALDPELKPEAAAERSEALEQLRGNQFARDALIQSAMASGPVNQAAMMLDVATDTLREEGAPEAELGGEGAGGKAQLDPKEDPPADLGEVAERVDDMADNGVPPEIPSDEGGEGGGGPDAPVMRSGDGGGDDIDPEEVRPLLEGSTAKPLPEGIATRLGRVLDHSLDHVMVHTDGKAAEAADKVHAHAFALGTHVFFAGGRYQPGAPGGDELLLHELTHVAQHDHGQLRGSSTGDLEVSKPGETAEMAAEGAARAGVVALRAADQNKPQDQVVPDNMHPLGRGMRPENQPMKQFMRGPLPEKGVIFREVDVKDGKGPGEGGREAVEFISHHPGFAGLGQDGSVTSESFGRSFGEGLTGIVSEWIADTLPEIDLVAIGIHMLSQFGEAMQILGAAAKGDMACCERITEVCEGIQETLAEWQSAEGAFGKFKTQLSGLSSSIGEFVTTSLEGIANQADVWLQELGILGGLEELQKMAEETADSVLDFLGLPELSKLQDQILTGAADFAGEGMAVAADALAQAKELLIDLPGFDELASIGDIIVEAAQAASWLYENWGNPGLWEDDPDKLQEEFATFGSTLASVARAWNGGRALVAQAGAKLSAAQEWMRPIVESPWFAAVATMPGMQLPAAGVAIMAYADSDVFAGVSEALTTAGAWLAGTLDYVTSAAGLIILLIGSPATAIAAISGVIIDAVDMLPECYQEPIAETVISLLGAGLDLLTSPLLAFGKVPGAIHEAVGTITESLLGLSHPEQMSVLETISDVLKGALVSDFLQGLLLGALEGVWEEIKGILTLLVGATVAVPAAVVGLLAAVPLLAKALRDSDSEEGEEQQEEEEETDLPLFEFQESDISPGAPIDAIKDPKAIQEPPRFQDLVAIFGDLWSNLANSMTGLVDAATEELLEALQSGQSGGGSSGAFYTVGRAVGAVVAVVVLEIALTKGAGALAAGFAKLATAATKLPAALKGMKAIEKMMGMVMPVVRSTLDKLDDFISLVGRLPIPGARAMADAFKRLKGMLVRWSEDLTEAVRKKRKGKGEGGEEDETDERKTAKKAANKTYKKVKKSVGKHLLDHDDLEARIREKGDPKVDGIKVDYALEPNASGGWAVEAKAGGQRGKTAVSKERGWVAEPSRSVPGSKTMYGIEDAEPDNVKEVTELHDDFEAEWQRLCEAVEGDEHVDLAKAGKDFIQGVERDLRYPELDVFSELRKPSYDEDHATIEHRIIVAPNSTEDTDTYASVSPTLKARLDAIGRGEKDTLKGRFTTSDWMKAFPPMSLRTAQKNVAAGENLGRLYRASTTEILYNPIFAPEVPPLIEERLHAEGRTSPLLTQGPFGPSEVAEFCKRDARLKRLTANWRAGASEALANMASSGIIQATPDGKYTFDNAFPLPRPGMHTVKELSGLTLPDGKKRESHHVPAKALANAWSVELHTIVDDLPKKDKDAEFEHIWKPHADAILKRADALDAAHNSADGKTLTAILIHPDTHRGTDDAVHTANSKDTSEAIVIEVENHALLMRKKANDLVLANPQEEHWRDFIDACYEMVRDGKLEEGVDPVMAKQELAILEKAFGKGEAKVEKATRKSADNLEVTMKKAMATAFTLDSGRLTVALRRSSKDGDNTKHTGVLEQLQTKHDASAWSKDLSGPIQPE